MINVGIQNRPGFRIIALTLFAIIIALQPASAHAEGTKSNEQKSGLFSSIGSFLGIGDDDSLNDNVTENSANDKEAETKPNLTAEDLSLANNDAHIYGKSDYDREKALETMKISPPVPNLRPIVQGIQAMSEENVRLYKQIFQLQETGQWDKADAISEKLTDIRLRGHYLYQRYMHPTAYTSTFDELKSWLHIYADHPGSENVYKLAMARKPAGFKGHINTPETGGRISGVLREISIRPKHYRSPEKRSYHQRASIRQVNSRINRYNDMGAPTRALNYLESSKAAKKYMDSVEYDRALSRIAQRYYHAGIYDKAYELSRQAAERSGRKAPVAGWVAGLTSWRKGKMDQAARYFEMTGSSDYAGGWTTSAGAYWAARAHLQAGNFKQVSPWMTKAAKYKRTFYGLIANRALGRNVDFNWHTPLFNDRHEQTLKYHKAGWRALALLEAGEIEKAESELIHLHPGRNSDLRESLIALAQTYNLPALSLRLGSAFPDENGRVYEAALYPLMSWEPRSGYSIDRALIHAFIRQESRFEIEAQSHSGATGLMQLMLRTASYVDGERTFRSHNRHLLEHPSTNLDIGQKYIRQLLELKNVEGDLLSLTIAYNAGPGNLAKWKDRADMTKDPLLFIESIPLAETRAFVERVLSNYWIYRMRFNQPTPSLDEIAQDRLPIYRPQEADSIRMASIN